jgi:hypothetical protein
MGKVGKYGNLYDRNGVLLKRCNSKGVLERYTLKEVQDLVDKLGTEKDENGNIKDPVGFNNASYILMQMYNNPKYNKEKENFIKDLNDRLRVNKEEVGKSLYEFDRGLQQSEDNESSDTNSEREAVQISRESGNNKEREACDESIKPNLDEQEVTQSKSYDVNDNKEEYVEYKEN